MQDENISTYRVLTGQRILQNHGISIEQRELQRVLLDPGHRYFEPLNCTFDLLYNQLILEQAYTYLSVAQQMIVDIAFAWSDKDAATAASEENAENSSSNHVSTEARIATKIAQDELIQINQNYSDENFFLQELVAETQCTIREILRSITQSKQEINSLLAPFRIRADDAQKHIMQLHTNIRNLIIDINKIIPNVPNYNQTDVQHAKLTETLAMMMHIEYNANSEIKVA